MPTSRMGERGVRDCWKDHFVCFTVPFFADLVVIARSLYPIPSRTRPSKSSAPMVLSLKAWKSRSPPGLPRTERFILFTLSDQKPRGFAAGFFYLARSNSQIVRPCHYYIDNRLVL